MVGGPSVHVTFGFSVQQAWPQSTRQVGEQNRNARTRVTWLELARWASRLRSAGPEAGASKAIISARFTNSW